MMRWILTIFLICWSIPSAWSQESESFALPSFSTVPPSETLYQQTKDWLQTLQSGQRRLAKNLLKDLYQTKQDLGIPNVLSISEFLLSFGDRAFTKSQWKEALYFYREATHFSPMLSTPYFRMAWTSVYVNWRDWRTIVLYAQRGWGKLWNEPLQRASLNRFTLVFGLIFGFLFLLCWWLILLLRSRRSVESNILMFFPEGISLFQVRCLYILILCLPVLIGLSWIEALLFWLLFSWLEQGVWERVFSSFGVVFLCVLPFALNQLRQADRLAQSTHVAVYLLHRTEGRKDTLRQVERLRETSPKDVSVLWSLALHHKRKGELNKAKALFLEARKWSSHPGLLLNLGNLDFLEQRSDAALSTYRKILKSRSVRTEVYYNLGQLLRHGKNTKLLERGGEYRNAALFGEKSLWVNQFNKQQKTQVNRYLLDVEPPLSFYEQSFAHKNNVLFLWSSFSSLIPWEHATWFLGSFLVLLWLGLLLERWLMPGEICRQCGSFRLKHVRRAVAKRSKELQGQSNATCPCIASWSMNSTEDHSRRRVQKELEMARYQRGMRRLSLWLGCLLPGWGQLLFRRAWKSALYLGGFVLLLTLGLSWFWVHPILSEFQPAQPLSWSTRLGWVGGLVLIWILNIRDIWKNNRSHS